MKKLMEVPYGYNVRNTDVYSIFSNQFLDSFFEIVTMLGEDLFFIIVIAIFYWCFNKNFGYKLAFVYLTSGAINTIIKEVSVSKTYRI